MRPADDPLTSLTIPDVVYVVDTGTCKQKRFDPERRLSSLVATFTGTSNMEQRAGRAGRHRPGQYYSLVSARRRAILPEFHLVEMKRLDLSNMCVANRLRFHLTYWRLAVSCTSRAWDRIFSRLMFCKSASSRQLPAECQQPSTR